jgi:hypothetical protein
MRLITLVTRRAAGYRTRRSMFVPAWFSNEPARSTPHDDRQIAPTLLSPSRDLAGAKRIAEAAASMPLKWEACRALRAFSSTLVRARGSRNGKDGWYKQSHRTPTQSWLRTSGRYGG